MKPNIYRKIARGFLDKNKLYKKVLLFTISISVGLILLLLLLQGGKDELYKQTQCGKAQIKLIGINESQLSELEASKDISWYGIEDTLGMSIQEYKEYIVKFVDTNYIEKQKKFMLEGNIPIREDEILVSKHFAENQENSIVIGSHIDIDLTGNGSASTYKISGIVDDKMESAYIFYVDSSMWEKYSLDQTHNVYVRLNTDVISSGGIMSFTQSILQDTSIDKGQIFLTEYFSVMSGLDRRSGRIDFVIYFFIISVITALLVYSSFYSSIMSDVKYLGQLMCIGFSKKMIRKIILNQMTTVALKGFLYAIVPSVGLAFLVYPKGIILNNIFKSILISTVLLCVIMVFTMGPILRIIGKISPNEGMRFSSFKKSKSKKTKKVTLENITKSYLFKNPKKTIANMIFFTITGFVLILSLVLNNSIDIEKRARTFYFQDGEIQLSLSDVSKTTFNQKEGEEAFYSSYLQREDNPFLDNKFLQSLESIEGIKAIHTHNVVSLAFTKQESGGSLTTISNKFKVLDQSEFEKIKGLLDTDIGYQDLLDKMGIIVTRDLSNKGEKYVMSYRDSSGEVSDEEMTVMATYIKLEASSEIDMVPNNDILIPKEIVTDLTMIENPIGLLSLELDDSKHLPRVKEEVQKLILKTGNIDLWSLDESISSIGFRFEQGLKLVKVVSLILFIFSIVSIVSSFLSTLFSRKEDIKLLTNLGLSIKETSKIMVNEHKMLIIGSNLVCLIIFVFMGKWVLESLDKNYQIITVNLPIFQIIIFIWLQALLLLVINFVTKKRVESIKIEE